MARGVSQNTFWTLDRVSLLRKRIDEGWSGSQIARELKCSRNQIIGKVHRLGLTLANSRAHLTSAHEHRAARTRTAVKQATKPSGPSEPRQPRFIPPPPDEPGPTAKPFLQRKPRECAWIFADAHADAVCCGKRVVDFDYEFCPEHRARVLTKARVVRKGHFFEIRLKGRGA